MTTILLIILIVLTLAATYIFWIRPILKTRPSFADYYAQEDSFWAALSLKFSGLKQKLTTAIVMIAGFVVTAYDSIVSLAQQVGFDWGNVATITSKIPSWTWPLVGMGLIALVQWFRNIGEKRTEQALVAKGIDPAPILNPPLPKGL